MIKTLSKINLAKIDLNLDNVFQCTVFFWRLPLRLHFWSWLYFLGFDVFRAYHLGKPMIGPLITLPMVLPMEFSRGIQKASHYFG